MAVQSGGLGRYSRRSAASRGCARSVKIQTSMPFPPRALISQAHSAPIQAAGRYVQEPGTDSSRGGDTSVSHIGEGPLPDMGALAF